MNPDILEGWSEHNRLWNTQYTILVVWNPRMTGRISASYLHKFGNRLRLENPASPYRNTMVGKRSCVCFSAHQPYTWQQVTRIKNCFSFQSKYREWGDWAKTESNITANNFIQWCKAGSSWFWWINAGTISMLPIRLYRPARVCQVKKYIALTQDIMRREESPSYWLNEVALNEICS